jgi:hypothetical protein
MSRFTIRTPDVPNLVVPIELSDLDTVREYQRLREQLVEATAELRELASGEGAAAEADRTALAAAMASGKPDPGDKHLTALAEQVEAQQRRVNGLADAARAAYATVEAEVADNACIYLATSEVTLEEIAEDVDRRLDGLAHVLGEADRVHRCRRWLTSATDPNRAGRGLPEGFMGADAQITLGTTAWERSVVFDALRLSLAGGRR